MAKSKSTRTRKANENQLAFERNYPGLTCHKVFYGRVVLDVFLRGSAGDFIKYGLLQNQHFRRVPRYGVWRPTREERQAQRADHIFNIRHMKNGKYSVNFGWCDSDADLIAKEIGIVREKPAFTQQQTQRPGESRIRRLGRRQMPIQYQVCGQLIVPNWAEHTMNTAIMMIPQRR